MITRFGQWVTVLILVVILVLSALPQVARGEEEGTPVVEPDICELATDADACVGPTPTDTAIIDRDGDGQADSIDPCPDDLLDGCLETSRSVADQDDDGGSDVPILAAQTSPPTVVEVYCDIPDINSPDLRTVGTFVDARAGYGDPTVTFTLYDLNGTVISATGSFPMPASNPITASSPYPNNWQWGPGGYSQLTVTAVYPSDDPASYPDATSSVTISCVPDAPTPTPSTSSDSRPIVHSTPVTNPRGIHSGIHDGNEGLRWRNHSRRRHRIARHGHGRHRHHQRPPAGHERNGPLPALPGQLQHLPWPCWRRCQHRGRRQRGGDRHHVRHLHRARRPWRLL